MLKVVPCSLKTKYFFIIMKVEDYELGMKFKLKKENIMAPISYGA